MYERLITSSVALFLLGVSLRMSLRLLYGARGPAPEDLVYLVLRVVGWILVVAPLIVLAFVGANWLSLLLMVAIVEALVELVLARRASQRQAVWRLIVAAVGSGRSLEDALQFHQRRFSGIVGRWQRRLGAELKRGVDWRDAVAHNAPAVPREAPAFAAIVKSGAPPSTLAADIDELRFPAYQQLQQEAMQRFMYLGTVCLVMIAIMSFVMIKVVPSFQAIFEDFDLELPAITMAVITAANSFAAWADGPLLVGCLLGAVAALVLVILYLCDRPVLQPITDRLTMPRHRAQVMRLLAAGFDQEQPIDATLEQLAAGQGRYPSAAVRRRIDAARERVGRGDEWSDALRAARLISSGNAAVLRTAQLAGNLPWALRLMAQRRVRLAAFRWAVLQQFAFVGLILTLGFCVFVYAVAMFIPLVRLINNLVI